MRNILTFDVEDWPETMLELFEIPVSRPTYPTDLVVQQTLDVLDILKMLRVEATFFILGTVAEKFPALVSEISKQGHEIGSHGYTHRLLSRQTPQEFSRDLAESLSALSGATTQQIISYRAPFFSMTSKSLWALDVLARSGFQYDSSIFPIRRPLYGIPGAQRFIHQVTTQSGALISEIPLSTLRFGKTNIPVAGGGYFRLPPYAFTKWAIRRLNSQAIPAVVYIHPHDLCDVPQLSEEIQRTMRRRGSATSKVLLRLQSIGRGHAKDKLLRLLTDFEFSSIRGVLKSPEE